MLDLHDKKDGFTLAEALLTLLIISIIVALSTAIVAKKNKKLRASNETHYWLCTRDGFEGGHTMDSNVTTSSTASANSCTFEPPAGVNRFNVTVIGGGGGGASGYASRELQQIYTDGHYNIVPSFSGDYYVLLVGAGGGGGGHNWKCGNGDLGGRSGALISDYVNLDKKTTYSLTVGKHGNGASGSHTGGSGGSTTLSGGGLNLVAGGGGGGARRTPKFPVGCKNRDGGEPGKYSPYSLYGLDGYRNDERYGAYILWNKERDKVRHSELAARLPYGHNNAGCGGRGFQNKGQDGCDGIALLQLLRVYGGGGGQSGDLGFYRYYQSPGRTQVTVGKGGRGAQTIDSDGLPGTASRFGSKVIAGGGDGGKKRALLGESSHKSNGEPGYRSLMPTNLVDSYSSSTQAAAGTATTDGGAASTPGGGGGGGGADGDNGTWTKGGNGAPGIVIVTW